MTDTDTSGTTTDTPDATLAVAEPGPLLTEGDEPSSVEIDRYHFQTPDIDGNWGVGKVTRRLTPGPAPRSFKPRKHPKLPDLKITVH